MGPMWREVHVLPQRATVPNKGFILPLTTAFLYRLKIYHVIEI
jgi:hypothetical protein